MNHRSCFLNCCATAGLLAVVAVLAAGVGSAVAAPEPAAPAVDEPTAEAVSADDSAVRESFLTADRELSPMLQTIKAAWQEQAAAQAKLDAELAAAPDARAALEVQQRIDIAMRDFEIRVLRIQLDFARREGRTEVAERLAASIEAMVSPPSLRTPVERPAPAGDR